MKKKLLNNRCICGHIKSKHHLPVGDEIYAYCIQCRLGWCCKTKRILNCINFKQDNLTYLEKIYEETQK